MNQIDWNSIKVGVFWRTKIWTLLWTIIFCLVNILSTDASSSKWYPHINGWKNDPKVFKKNLYFIWTKKKAIQKQFSLFETYELLWEDRLNVFSFLCLFAYWSWFKQMVGSEMGYNHKCHVCLYTINHLIYIYIPYIYIHC